MHGKKGVDYNFRQAPRPADIRQYGIHGDEAFEEMLELELNRTQPRKVSNEKWGAREYGPLLENLVTKARFADGKNYTEGGVTHKERYYWLLLELDPENVTGLIELARYYIYRKQFTRSIALLERAVLNDPKDPFAYAYLAKAYTYAGQYDVAKRVIDTACTRGFGNHHKITLARGILAAYQNDQKELALVRSRIDPNSPLREEINKILKGHPIEESDSPIWNKKYIEDIQRAEQSLRVSKPDEAIAYVAPYQDEDDLLAHWIYARACMIKGKNQQVTALLVRLIERHPHVRALRQAFFSIAIDGPVKNAVVEGLKELISEKTLSEDMTTPLQEWTVRDSEEMIAYSRSTINVFWSGERRRERNKGAALSTFGKKHD